FQDIPLDPGEEVHELIGQDGGRNGGTCWARGARRLRVARPGLRLSEGERDGPKQERKGETRQETAHHADTIAPPPRAGNLSEQKKNRGMVLAAPCPALLVELGYVLERDPEPRGAGIHVLGVTLPRPTTRDNFRGVQSVTREQVRPPQVQRQTRSETPGHAD